MKYFIGFKTHLEHLYIMRKIKVNTYERKNLFQMRIVRHRKLFDIKIIIICT